MEEVRVWEEQAVIPTYEAGAPDRNPMFLEKRVYQGSSGKIYPYPTIQEISLEKTDKMYQAVWLENQYLRIMILPELGGRIQRAYDKTNGYDFVYYNHVIKPALVGLCGPWISGGIEFNWPQHHRPTTFSPVDYIIRKNCDGSASVLTGDVDQMNGTREITTFTLYPDRAYIEVRGQLYNRTPLPQTFLWWANPAVAANDQTQSIFPPDVHSVYDHGKRAVSRFPIATGEYYKHDYSEGVDISRYKNIPVPTSYMAEKSKYNFVGGYDYGRRAGLLHVADHHVSPGKKQWTWGCGDFGKAWDRNLTDEDGPYVELMTGMYCDNQPDFTWLKPYEEKVFHQYFMPYKAVGQVKNATVNAALNVEKRGDGLYVCVYATGVYEDARIIVRRGAETLAEECMCLSPNDVYEKTLPINIVDLYQIRVSVEEKGKELVAYQPEDPGIPKLAEPAKAARDPKEIMTNEELYLTGRHIEQYRHATWLPDSYYLEGLKRDDGDSRINNAYGLLLLRRGKFAESEPYFRRAIGRLTELNPNPYNSEPYYNLGLSLFYQDRMDEAYDAFYKATWSNEQQEMAFYYLACIACRRGDFTEALMQAEKGLVKNAHNVKARGLKAEILHRLKRDEAALCWIDDNLALDSFDYMSAFVKAQIKGGDSELDAIHARSRDFHETFLQTARDFAEAGFYEEALTVLREYPGNKPMIAYYTGAYLLRTGRKAEAEEAFAQAEKCPPYCCFPNKPEDIAVLSDAIRANPEGAKAPYYLGCLWYDRLQYDDAVSLWLRSEKLDPTFPTLLRNLAIAFANRKHDQKTALSYLERAFALDPTDARVFLELDQLRRLTGCDAEKRLKAYKQHMELIGKRDDLYTEYVTVLNLNGRFEEAHAAITKHTFRTWEGAEGRISAQFKLSILKMAEQSMRDGAYEKAADQLREALSYPHNLGEGRLEGTKDNHLYYHLGLALDGMGQKREAERCYRLATLGAMEPAGMMYYYDQPADMILYQGLAFQKLGDRGSANTRFYRLLDYGEKHLRDSFRMDYFAVSMPDFTIFDEDMTKKNRAHCFYLMGLGKLGLRRFDDAAKDFRQALELEPAHQNAALYLFVCKEENDENN